MKKLTFLWIVLSAILLLSACQAAGGNTLNAPTGNVPAGTPQATTPPTAPPMLSTDPIPTQRPVEPTTVVEPQEPQPLDAETEAELQAHFRNKFNREHDCRLEYFGCYADCYVVFTNSHVYTQATGCETIGGYTFWYSDGQRLTVYRSGESLELKEAWAQSWLSNEAMARLHAWYKSQHTSLYN